MVEIMNSADKKIFIHPSIEKINAINISKEKSLFESREKKFVKDISELHEGHLNIVVSRPGIGKSRMLKELVLRANSQNKKGIYINLKHVEEKNYEEVVKAALKNGPKQPYTNKEISKVFDHLFTEQFELSNSPDIIICLDALDEVPHYSIESHILKLIDFKRDYQHVRIVLSCRDYIYARYENYLLPLNPSYFSIQPFNTFLIHDYLNQCEFKGGEIQKIIDRFGSRFYFEARVIDSPRILEIFVAIKESEGLESALTKSRSELIEHFIQNLLLEEDKKYSKNEKELKRRLLDILALNMQIYLADIITKDEFITFLSDVHTHLSSAILTTIPIDDFFDHSLFIPDFDTVTFQNTEYQEYMAALELTRLSKTNQVVFDLAFDSKLHEFYPHWINTLKFLVDLRINIQIELLQFIVKRNSSSDKAVLEGFLSDDLKKISQLEGEVRNQTFKIIFELYQRSLWYIYGGLATKLPLYWSEAHELELLKYLTSTENQDGKYVQRLNALDLLEELVLSLKIPYEIKWERILREIIVNDSNNAVRERAVAVIAAFKSWELLIEIHQLVAYETKLRRVFIQGFNQLNPNDPYTIDLIAESIKDGGDGVLPNDNFDQVNSEEAFFYLLQKFINEEKLRESYSPYQTAGDLDRLQKNLENVWSLRLEESTKEFIRKSDSLPLERSGINSMLVSAWKNKNAHALAEVIDWYRNDPGAKTNSLYWYFDLFKALLSPANAEFFITEVEKIPSAEWIVHFFWKYRYEKEEEKKQIFEISKKYFSDKYDKGEPIPYDEQPEIRKRYEEFRFKLEPKLGQYVTDVFESYSSWKNIIAPYITEDDKTRLKKLLTETVIKHFDFSRATITIIVEGKTKTYNVSNFIPIYASAFSLFEEFGIPAAEFRPQMVQFIPFCFTDNERQKIFQILKPLAKDEIDWLVTFYQDPKNTNAKVANLESLIQAIEKLNIVEAYPVLKSIVFDPLFESYNRLRVLNVINEYQIDTNFNREIFRHYENSNEEFEKNIAEKANEILVVTESPFQEQAIKWRVQRIISNPISYIPDEGHGSFDPNEIEFRTHSFNAPLGKVTNSQFINQYLDLLRQTIGLYKSKKEYRSYAVYAWDTVANYFEQLKVHKSLTPLNEFEATIKNSFPFSGYSFLEVRLQRVKQSYLKDIRKPDSFSTCIQVYNELKERSYLRISSVNDFEEILQDILQTDVRNWIEKEGAYKLINTIKLQEDLIQKSLKSEIEKGLLRRGFRDTEIIREPQLIDNTKPDYLISYGFIGKVVMELKLTKNSEVKSESGRKKYKNSLLKYLEGSKADKCFYLLFQVDSTNRLEIIRPKVEKVFADYPQVKVMDYNCTKG